jgi:hypothetical protein
MVRVRGPVLVAVGVVALALSFALTPTPDTFMVLSNGHRVRTPATMQAVDYAILMLRIGGVVAVLAGMYLTDRRWRPDRILDGDDVPGDGYDPYAAIPPEAGSPAARGAVIRDWRAG